MLDVVERTADKVFIPLTVGGGLRSVDDMRAMLRAGADKVSLNSSAVADPALIRQGAEKFGSQCIVLSIDARWNGQFYEVYTHGGRRPPDWTRPNGPARGCSWRWRDCAEQHRRRRTEEGYDLRITRAIADSVEVPLVASGGAGEIEHLRQAVTEGGAEAALAASIFHFGTIRINEVKRYLAAHGVAVRPTYLREAPDESA